MRSLLATAWHLVRHRAVADRTVLLAAGVTILLATTLLAAGPQYAAAVAESGLRERLAAEPGDEVGIEVALRAPADSRATLDREVTALLDGTVGPWIERRATLAESDSLRSEVLPDRHVTSLALTSLDDEHVEVVAGQAPQSPSGTIHAMVSEDAVELLGGVGAQLTLLRRDDVTVDVEIVGVFRPTRLTDRIWWRDPTLTEGVTPGAGFTTVGPLVTDPAGFAELGDYRATLTWRALPDAAAVVAPEIGQLRAEVESLEAEIQRVSDAGAIRLTSGLRDILTDASSTLRATQAAVIVTTIQLAVLALYALGLAAGLLVDGRLVETELVRARGAEPRQLGMVAAMEGTLLVVPAVAVAPWLAAVVVRLLARTGVLSEIGLTLTPRVDVGSYVGATLAGIASVVVLTLPAVRSARTFSGVRAARGRASAIPFAQRTGLDLALLVVALLGLWQLRRVGGPVQDDAAGRAGIDPLLVAAPALGLLAGAVLTLRFVPLAGRLAERLVSRARTLVPVLGAWQLSRRPGRLARSVLLLVLAVAIGTFAATYGGTWSQSQADQAGLAVGADLVVSPDRRPAATLGPAVLADALGRLDGVDAVGAATTDRVPLPRNRDSAILVGVDTAVADRLLTVRSDLLPNGDAGGLADLTRPLDLGGVALPVSATDPAVTFTTTIDVEDGTLPGGDLGLQLIVKDANELVHRLAPAELSADGSSHMVTVPLAVDSDGVRASIAAPLELVGIDLTVRPASLTALQAAPSFVVTVTDLAAAGEPVAFDTAAWLARPPSISGVPTVSPLAQFFSKADDGFALRGTSGGTLTGSGLATFRIVPEGSGQPGSVPVLVTPAYRAALGNAEIGTEVIVRVRGTSLPIEIVGEIPVLPGHPHEELGLLADVGTVATHKYAIDRSVTVPDQWMLAVGDATAHEQISSVLAAAPFDAVEVTSRAQVTRSLRTDPVAVGLIGALTLGFGAAAAFAAVGYLVSAVVAARERLGEFALLRALGTSHRETRRWLTIESASTVIVSLGGGIVLGLGLAWLILPSVSLARDGGAAVPEPVVVIPWVTLAIVAAGAAVVLLAVPTVVTRMLARTRVAEVLRLGDEG